MKKLFGGNKKKEKEGTLVGKVVVVGPFSVRVEAVVGEGGFATIYRCTDIKTGLAYALKHMRLAPDTVDEVKAEAKVMARLKGHPNILRLHAVAFGGPTGAETDGFMLLDFCPLTLLEVMQRSNFVLDDFLVYEVFQDVVWAVAHMHKCNPPLAHRDLKAENVLKNGEGRWVICDFGSATSRAQVYDSAADIAAEEEVIRRTTTPAYRAPEMWDLYTRQRIDTAVDVWALGVLLYVLAFGKLPFPGDSKLAILYGKYEMPPGRPPAMRALIQDMLQVNPADRPDIFQIISKLDLLRNVLTSEASGGSNSGTPALAPPSAAAAAGADGHAAPAAPHPHPYPMPVPGAAPPPHVLPGQQLPYPRQGSMGGPAPGPPGPMPPHPQQHAGVPPPGWVPPGPPGAHHPPPPYFPGQGPPGGPPGPHGAPHPPAYAQPRPGGGPPPPQQVQRQLSRGGSFNPAWPVAAGGPPGGPGGPPGAPGPQGAPLHPQGPPPPHLQQPHPHPHPHPQQPYPYPQQPLPASAQLHHAAPQAPQAPPQQPQPQPDLLGDAFPDPPVIARSHPDRRTSGSGLHAAVGFGDDADWAGASAASTSAPFTAPAAPADGAARASGAAGAHAGAAPGDVDWGEQPAFGSAHSVAAAATPAPTPSGGVSHLHQPQPQPQPAQVPAQRAASQAAPGDLMSLDSMLPATPPPSFSQPGKAQSGPPPPQPAVAAAPAAPAPGPVPAAAATAAVAAAPQEPPPAPSGLSPMSSHVSGVSGVNSSAPNSRNLAATAAAALQPQQPAGPATAPSPVLMTPAAWSPLEATPAQAGAHSDAAAGLRPMSGAGTAVAMLTPAGPDGGDTASLRAEVARLAAANSALEGRVRQLEGLVAAQGSALQRLTADLASVQLQQQQQQHHSHSQHQANHHHHGAGSGSSSFGGAGAAPPQGAGSSLPPATVSRLAPHSGASARLPGSGGATGGTGGGSGHPGLLLTSGGAAGGGTGGSSFTSGAFTSGPGGGGGGPGGNQLLAGMGSGLAEEGPATSGRLAANGGVAVAGAGAGSASGGGAFPAEDGFGESSPWMSERPPSGSAPYPPIGYEDLT